MAIGRTGDTTESSIISILIRFGAENVLFLRISRHPNGGELSVAAITNLGMVIIFAGPPFDFLFERLYHKQTKGIVYERLERHSLQVSKLH